MLFSILTCSYVSQLSDADAAEPTGNPPPTEEAVTDATEASEQPGEVVGEEPVESRLTRAVDGTHSVISGSIEAAVLRIDRFFSREKALRDSSESWVRLRPEVGYDTDDQVDWDFNVAARIDLPGLSGRASLVMWSDGDRIEEDDRFTDTLDHDTSGGIALERDSGRAITKWNVRPAIGLKSGSPVDPFLQLRETRFYNV